MKYFSSLVLLVLATACHANSDLYVSFPSERVEHATDLGNVEVAGVGAVKLVAEKKGNQLIVLASDPDGKVIGQAESVVGMSDTPIYVLTPAGLKKITIFWSAE